MTPDEFAQTIKAKHPEYKNQDNLTLAQAVVKKYPEYASKVDFGDSGKPSGFNPVRALLTNDQTSGFGEELVRGIPSAIGAIVGGGVGGIAGAPTGPGAIATSMAGAALGGTGGEGLRQSAAQMYNIGRGRDTNPPREVLGRMGYEGAVQGIGQGVGIGVGAGLRAIAKPAAKVGSQVMRAMAGIPETSGEAALRDLGTLGRAVSAQEARIAYKEGVGEAGDTSMEAGRRMFGKTYPGPEAVVNTFDEVADSLGAASHDELLGMRQTMMTTLSDTSRSMPKLRSMISERIGKLDTMLEDRLPDWSGAKKIWREMKVGEDFSSWLPQNKNLSPNVLRTTGAVAATAQGLGGGSPIGLLALPLISPKVYGAAIRTAGALSGPVSAVAPSVLRGAAGAIGSEPPQFVRKYIVAPSDLQRNYKSP